MHLNDYGMPPQIGDWIKGPDSYDHLDEIARINDKEEKELETKHEP